MKTESPRSVLVRVEKPIQGHDVGSEVRVFVDVEGTPLDYWWRRRFRDAERDGCVRVVDPAPKRSRKRAPAPAVEPKTEEAGSPPGEDHQE